MYKWEYMKRFRERFQKYAFFKDMSLKRTYGIYLILKLIQTVTLVIILNSFKDKIYAIQVMGLLYFMYFIIDLRDGQSKIKTQIENQKIYEFYESYSRITHNRIIGNVVLSEMLWGLGDLLSVDLPFLAVLGSAMYGITGGFLFALGILIVVFGIKLFYMYYKCKQYAAKERTYNCLNLGGKVLCLVGSMWIGVSISDYLQKCPLDDKTDTMDALTTWIKGAEEISFAITKDKISALIVLFIVLTLGMLILVLYKRRCNGIAGSYLFYCSKGLVSDDFGSITVAFIGFFMGTLYQKGCAFSPMSAVLGILLVGYTVVYIVDDLFSFHDELLLDSDDERLYFWKENFSTFINMKKGLFYRNFKIPVFIIYTLSYMFTFKSFVDIPLIILNLSFLWLLLQLGFIKRSQAIVDSPQKATGDYEKTKYHQGRMIENNTVGGELIFITTGMTIPGILYMCGDLNYIFFVGTYVTLLVGLWIYIMIQERKLQKNIQDLMFIVGIFDGE